MSGNRAAVCEISGRAYVLLIMVVFYAAGSVFWVKNVLIRLPSVKNLSSLLRFDIVWCGDESLPTLLLSGPSKQASNKCGVPLCSNRALFGGERNRDQQSSGTPTDRPTDRSSTESAQSQRLSGRTSAPKLTCQSITPPARHPHHGQPPPPPTTTHMYKYDRCFPQRWAARLSRAVQRLTTRLSYITSLDTKRYDTRRTRRPGSATPDRPSAPFPHLFDVEPNPTHSRRLCLPALIP